MAGEEATDGAAKVIETRTDLYVHFPDGIPITVTLEGEATLNVDVKVTIVETPPGPGPATHAKLTILTGKEDPNMPSTIDISVDDTGATAVLTFLDDHQDPTNPPVSPSDGTTPAVVAYATDNPAVATVDPASGKLTEVSAGTVNVSATVNDANNGTPVLEPDGVTPFAPPAQNVTVTPGAAASDVFTVTP